MRKYLIQIVEYINASLADLTQLSNIQPSFLNSYLFHQNNVLCTDYRQFSAALQPLFSSRTIEKDLI